MRSAITRRTGGSRPIATTALLLAFVQATACAQTSPARISAASETPAMSSNATRVESDDVVVDVRFEARDGAPLEIHYRLHNTGAAPLAVFDRGNRHAVLTKRHATGDIGQPGTRDEGNGDITLSHVASPLPDPSPTLPPVPLAAKVESGGVLEGRFTASPMTLEAPRRLRWCLGVSAFDAARFSAPEQVDGIEIWHASFDEAARQKTVCTPWFDIASNAFET